MFRAKNLVWVRGNVHDCLFHVYFLCFFTTLSAIMNDREWIAVVLPAYAAGMCVIFFLRAASPLCQR